MGIILLILILIALAIILYQRKKIKSSKSEPPIKICGNPKIKKATKLFNMATNHIEVNFTPCEPPPSGGYIIKYRPIGDVGPYRDAPGNPYMTSPAEWDDLLDDADTEYEGTIQSDCGDGNVGNVLTWATEGEPPAEPNFEMNQSGVGAEDNGLIDMVGDCDGPPITPIITLISGSWPLNTGEQILGTHAGHSGNLCMRTNGIAMFGVHLRFYKNGILVHCTAVNGGQSGGIVWAAANWLPTDYIRIDVSDTPC